MQHPRASVAKALEIGRMRDTLRPEEMVAAESDCSACFAGQTRGHYIQDTVSLDSDRLIRILYVRNSRGEWNTRFLWRDIRLEFMPVVFLGKVVRYGTKFLARWVHDFGYSLESSV